MKKCRGILGVVDPSLQMEAVLRQGGAGGAEGRADLRPWRVGADYEDSSEKAGSSATWFTFNNLCDFYQF